MSNTSSIWQMTADGYWPSPTALNADKLPAVIYRFVATQRGWYLEKTHDKFVFPYKVYGTNTEIIERVQRAWRMIDSGFGILLNGLKGTGKTITAQMIVNWAISNDIVILNVQEPIPLADVLMKIKQPVLVLFDEFEKTHDERLHPECQQKMLSVLDGLSRSEHKRLFLFTTNTRKVNENFVDRPSRIRYSWEFGRLSAEVIEMLLDDMLDKSLTHMRNDIISYLNTREVLTIDVAKTVIIECNVFKEVPNKFKQFLNLTEKEPGPMLIELLDEQGNVKSLYESYRMHRAADFMSYMSPMGRKRFVETFTQKNHVFSVCDDMQHYISVIGPTDKDNEWICHAQVPKYKTWIGTKLSLRLGDNLWLDEKPENWTIPTWALKIEEGKELTDDEDDLYRIWLDRGRVYGTEKSKPVKLRFTPKEESYTYNYRSLLV